jgi:membrane protein YqaA with SNARE-associated domain
MDPGELTSSLGIYLATFVIAVVGSVVPIISIEVFLIGLVMIVGPADAVPIVALAAIGQTLGKLPIYFGTRGLTGLLARQPATGNRAGQRRRIERVRRWFARFHPVKLLAASALVGIPPFSLAATAAGVLAIPPRTFCAVVAIGRALRFAAIFAVARL